MARTRWPPGPVKPRPLAQAGQIRPAPLRLPENLGPPQADRFAGQPERASADSQARPGPRLPTLRPCSVKIGEARPEALPTLSLPIPCGRKLRRWRPRWHTYISQLCESSGWAEAPPPATRDLVLLLQQRVVRARRAPRRAAIARSQGGWGRGDAGALGLRRGLLGDEAFPQHELLHLARWREREFLEHGPVARRLVRREVLAAAGDQLVGVGRVAGRGRTNAATCSPQVASGTPTTATSATAGWANRTCSISRG